MEKIAVLLIIILMSVSYLPTTIALYPNGKSKSGSTGLNIAIAMLMAFGVLLLSNAAMYAFGVHDGYWVIAFFETLAINFTFVRYVQKQEEVMPTLKGTLVFLGCISFFWLVSLATGIAVQYSNMPFKI